jgi:hypothetical protein
MCCLAIIYNSPFDTAGNNFTLKYAGVLVFTLSAIALNYPENIPLAWVVVKTMLSSLKIKSKTFTLLLPL